MRIVDVLLDSPDPERAAAYYRERFGREWIRFREGDPPGPYHVALAIPPGSTRAAYDWIGEAIGDGIYDFSSWDADGLYFEDADGNILELIARKGPERGFAPGDVTGICEVGVPAADSPAAVERIEQTFGLEVFSGDRDTFTALGDPEGLLIVVREGRGWMPTGVPAAAGRAEVTVEAPRVGEVIAGATTIRSS